MLRITILLSVIAVHGQCRCVFGRECPDRTAAAECTDDGSDSGSTSGESGNTEQPFPALPDSPLDLIELLKDSGDTHTMLGPRLDYVQESDIAELVELLDSEEACGSVVLVISSILPAERSTVGHEAAYLIEGFWKRYYPTELSSHLYEPDMERIRRWFRQWSHLRKLAEQRNPSAGTEPD